MEKQKKIVGVGWGEGKGWFIRKNHVVGIFVVFVLAWYVYARALEHDSRNGVWDICHVAS